MSEGKETAKVAALGCQLCRLYAQRNKLYSKYCSAVIAESIAKQSNRAAHLHTAVEDVQSAPDDPHKSDGFHQSDIRVFWAALKATDAMIRQHREQVEDSYEGLSLHLQSVQESLPYFADAQAVIVRNAQLIDDKT